MVNLLQTLILRQFIKSTVLTGTKTYIKIAKIAFKVLSYDKDI